MTATVHAFVDESYRREYLLAACVVSPSALETGRKTLRALLRAQDRRLHFKAMNDQRRRETIARLCDADLRCWVLTGQGKPEDVRQECLRRLVQELLAENAQRLVLESRGEPDDRKDARTIQRTLGSSPSRTGLVHEHLRPYEDPLLWVPDAVSWCYGAGADWRRRAKPLVGRVIDVGAAQRRA